MTAPDPARPESSEAFRALFAEIERMHGVVALAKQERDAAVAQKRLAERERDEMAGIIETYGAARMVENPNSNMVEFVLTIDAWVFKAAGRRAFVGSLLKLLAEQESTYSTLRPVPRKANV